MCLHGTGGCASCRVGKCVISLGPTHRADADSDSREYIPTADSPFYRFSTPRSACRFNCVSALYRLCVSSRCTGCVCLRSLWDSPRIVSFGEWSRERSAPSSVARVCRLTPPYTRTTLCRLSLLHHSAQEEVGQSHLSRNERERSTTAGNTLIPVRWDLGEIDLTCDN